jgi:4-amino-4-deoxy-L-arabinose transferase-like glycosyltransferase
MNEQLRRAAKSLTLICVVALGLRLAFFWNYAAHNSKQALSAIPFLFESGNIAYSVATGHGFSSPFRVDTGPTAWMTPVYPLILAGIFRVFGPYTFPSFIAAALVNILATALASIPIYYAGKTIAGAGMGAGAAWLWAIFPNAIQIPSTSMWDASLSALLAAMILWSTVAISESKGGARIGSWIAYGLLWGLTLMTSATLAGLLPFLFAWLAYREHKRGRPWLAKPAIAILVAVLCCVPWTLRNYRIFHAWVPLRSILGLQLWVGNNPDASDRWLGTQHPIHDAGERLDYVDMGEIAYMRAKEDDAIRYMLAHPGREAHLISHRVLAFWSGGTPNPIRDFFHTNSPWFRFVLLFNVVVAIGALAGSLALIWNRNAFWFPLIVFPAVFPWAYYLTIVLPRYSLTIDPVVILLVAVAVGEALNVSRHRRSASFKVSAAARLL